MIKHIVMWTIKDSEDKAIVAQQIKHELDALSEKIKEIGALDVGLNYNSSPAAFDVVLYSEFNSKEDLDAYQVHPDHIKARDYIVSVVDKRAVVDYEV
jgi:hypothetical protein